MFLLPWVQVRKQRPTAIWMARRSILPLLLLFLRVCLLLSRWSRKNWKMRRTSGFSSARRKELSTRKAASHKHNNNTIKPSMNWGNSGRWFDLVSSHLIWFFRCCSCSVLGPVVSCFFANIVLFAWSNSFVSFIFFFCFWLSLRLSPCMVFLFLFLILFFLSWFILIRIYPTSALWAFRWFLCVLS